MIKTKSKKKSVANAGFQSLLQKMKTFGERITELAEYKSASEKLTKASVGIKKSILRG